MGWIGLLLFLFEISDFGAFREMYRVVKWLKLCVCKGYKNRRICGGVEKCSVIKLSHILELRSLEAVF